MESGRGKSCHADPELEAWIALLESPIGGGQRPPFRLAPRARWAYEEQKGELVYYWKRQQKQIERAFFQSTNARGEDKKILVSLDYQMRVVNVFTLMESNQFLDGHRPLVRATWFYKDKNSIWKPYPEGACNDLERALQDNSLYLGAPIQVSTDPKRFVVQHADGSFKQSRPNTKKNERDVVRGYPLLDSSSYSVLCISYEKYEAPDAYQHFGVPLDIVMKHPLNKGLEIPYIVLVSVQKLFFTGRQQLQFIWKENKEEKRLKYISCLLDIGVCVDISHESPHLIAGLLYKYIDELPEPLFPNKLYQAWYSVIKAGVIDQGALKECLLETPIINKMISKGILTILIEVGSRESITGMSVQELARIWARPFFRMALPYEQHFTMILTELIEKVDTYFADIPVPQFKPLYKLPLFKVRGDKVFL
eukprot:TRINITY_DN4019_c3_g1_i1.p1 TRINITY_DN4019_c3_g1~~TRINITY_DN4019_c3_g1_i1.p1  ORF type:complete len:422 (-),score=96.01 TRINITY_DN4019_c3_g1_i1:86-1351(-)